MAGQAEAAVALHKTLAPIAYVKKGQRWTTDAMIVLLPSVMTMVSAATWSGMTFAFRVQRSFAE